MPNEERISMDTLLDRIEKEGYLFPEFQLNKVDDLPKLLGQGGFAYVYEMVKRGNPKKQYALKVIGTKKHVIANKDFWTAVRLQKHLGEESAHIVRTLDARTVNVCLDSDGNISKIADTTEEQWDGEGLHLQLELLEKLENIISKDKFGKVYLLQENLNSEEEVIKFAMQIGQALLTMHNNHVLHRDVKLENIFWDPEEQKYKLGDFGLAKYTEGNSAETVIYTDGYGAPEIERKTGGFYDATADIYSFGITLYLLLNDLKFPGSVGYFANQVQYHPEFVFPAPKHASEGASRIIRKMCSYRSEDRYQSMKEVLMDIIHLGELVDMGEDDSFWELSDMVTETFYKADPSQVDNNKRVHKETHTDTRIEQKKVEFQYKNGCTKYFLALTLLFVIIMEGLSLDMDMMTQWQFWIVAVLCILTRIPLIIGSYFASLAMWLVLEVSNQAGFFEIIAEKDLTWIAMIFLLFLLSKFSQFRFFTGRIDEDKRDMEQGGYGWISLIMMISGIVLLILKHIGIINVPEIIEDMHLIRTGLLSYLLMIIFACKDEDTEEEQSRHVSVDE